MKEIGGEFYSYDIKKNKIYLKKEDNRIVNTLSGRTSIDYIIKDIIEDCDVNSALLPSYCCDSMIKPFAENNIEVIFYNIYIDENQNLSFDQNELLNILNDKKIGIILSMDYFGYNRNFVNNIFSYIGNDVVKVKDSTHSFFSDFSHNNHFLDYEFASLRKWTRFGGLSLCIKYNSDWEIERKFKSWEGTVLRKKAADLKYQYINHEKADKKDFLKMFDEAEELLDNDYKLYKASDEDEKAYESLDVEYIKKTRRKNAVFLIENLNSVEGINVIYKTLSESDCPLFVPIIVENDFRDKLKMYLIEKKIYCPVHWPLSRYHKFKNNKSREIYDKELSLICDQRYDLTDMERIVEEILNFIRRI